MNRQKFDMTLPTRLTIGASASLLVLAACGSDPAEEDNTLRRSDQYAAALQSFASCDELDGYLADVMAEGFAASYADDYYYGDVLEAGGGMGRGGDDFAVDAPTAGDAGGEANDGGGAQGPTDFTTTNVQEEGIDEPDLTKTNGEYTYVLTRGTLHILDSFPVEETHEVATVDIGGYSDTMFLIGDTVVTFHGFSSGEYDYGYDDYDGRGEPEPMPAPDMGAPEPAPDDEPGNDEPGFGGDEDDNKQVGGDDDLFDDGAYFEGVRVTIVDVSNPAAPSITRRFEIEGNYTSARLVDGRVYLVTNSMPWYVDAGDLEAQLEALDLPEVDYDATEAQRQAAMETAYAAVRPLVFDWLQDGGREQLLPDLRTADGRTELFDCTQLMHPQVRAGMSVLGVVGFDPTSDAAPTGSGVIADGWQVYGSASSIYVAQDSRWWSWYDRNNAYAETQIHRFSLAGGSPAYTASGAVPGWLLNQFSMSEYDGFLRVATTDQTNWGWGVAVAGGGDIAVDVAEPPTTVDVGEATDGGSSSGSEGGGGSQGSAGSSGDDDAPEATPDSKQNITRLSPEDEGDANNVFVLQQSGGELEIVSGIRGIAPTESIFAVRFLGEMGYVVTFRQTDPLYTVDLSDPLNPSIEGELHIPGYSNYLHPFGEDYLIGVGRDGTDDGRILDFQIQMFDVSDPTNPTRIHQEVLETGAGDSGWGWSSSETEHDHRAFTFYASQNLLAIPVTLEDYSGDWESETYSHFSGIIVYEVSAEDGFTEVGRVSHSFLAYDTYCSDAPEEGDCESWDFPWYVNMRRSTFIDNYLLAISDQGVTASSIDSLSEVLATVGFPATGWR